MTGPTKRPPYELRHGIQGNPQPVLGAGPMGPRVVPHALDPFAVVSGREVIAQASIPTLPISAVGILSGIWPKAMPRTLLLGVGATNHSGVGPSGDTQGYPPGAGTGSTNQSHLNYACGLIDAMDQPWPGVRHVGCVLELGCGGALSRVTFDWIQGAYRLPPCDFVRVSCQPWGTGWAASVVPFPAIASVSTQEMEGAHVPTATGSRAFAAGETNTLNVPSGARGVDVEPVPGLVPSANVITVTGAAYGVRDYAAGALVPGWTPLAVTDSSGTGNSPSVFVTSALAETVLLRWYIQL